MLPTTISRAPLVLLAALSLGATGACYPPAGPAGEQPSDPAGAAPAPPDAGPTGAPASSSQRSEAPATAVPDVLAPSAPAVSSEPTGGATTDEPPSRAVPEPVAPPEDGGVATQSPAGDERPTEAFAACAEVVQRMDGSERVGQLFMLAKDSRTPVDAAYLDLLTQTRPGSILLLGEAHAGVGAVAELTSAVREAAPTPEGVGLLVAADQEGGLVQRLQGPGFDRIPSAVEQAGMDDAALRDAAARWGGQLKAAGVDATLAPVADVVPPEWAGVNEPAGRLFRHYGPDAQQAQPKLAAFVQGMDEAGVATSLKHFPGLGRVVGNTDFSGSVVDAETGPTHPDLQAFRGEAGQVADMVMISTAVYDRIDPGVPAAFSEVVIDELLREELGFDGVVIADDLGVAAQVAHVPPGERAVRFLDAGGDIVINADPAVHREMVDAVHAAVADDPDLAAEVDDKLARVLAMKERRGVADCD